MAQRSSRAPLHWLRYGFAIVRNWICWQLHSRTLCSCHATRYWSPPTKAAHTSSQPRALFPDSCHPDTFSMKINKDPKDARSRDNLQRHLPRSFFREGKDWKWEDGTVQTFKIGAGAAFQASSVQYSTSVSFSPSESARRQREFCRPRPQVSGPPAPAPASALEIANCLLLRRAP